MPKPAPEKINWIAEWNFAVHLHRVEQEADSGRKQKLIYEALKTASGLGYPAGFSTDALGDKSAFVELPVGRIWWSLPPMPQDPRNQPLIEKHIHRVNTLRQQ